MSQIRPPAVAGTFYSNDPCELRAQVRGYLAAVKVSGKRPKAIIVPHAGYMYSGPIAASGYARLQPYAKNIRRVVLLGPSHRGTLQGLAAPNVDFFSTPLGKIPIDHAALELLNDLPCVTRCNQAHASEHSLEVQLPFLQVLLGKFTLVPLVVGESAPYNVAQVLERLWGDDETLIVVSSDLSHYHDYETAQRLDAATSQAIEELRYRDLNYEGACGRNPVNGLLYVAHWRRLRAQAVDVRNSGDTAGSREQVVGYGSYVIQ